MTRTVECPSREAAAAQSGPPRGSGVQAAFGLECEPDWHSVLDGRSEIGFGRYTLPPGLGAALAEGPDTCETTVGATPAELERVCARFCAAPEARHGLTSWLGELVEALQSLLPSARLRVRLERLRGPGCSRLHVDQVALRLLCTLHGPGTEWWPAPVPDRARLLRPGEAQTQPAKPLPRLPTGRPVLLRGERFPLHPGAGVVHRSPAPSGAARVLLAVDLAL